MLSLTDTTDLTSAERHALRIVRYTGSRFSFVLVAVLGAAQAVMFLLDHDVERLVYGTILVVLVAVVEWEHLGFSRLLLERDEEIRRLDAELRQERRVGKVSG